MKKSIITLIGATLFAATSLSQAEVSYQLVPDWLKPPAGMDHIGNSHGDAAVDSKGNVYISVEGDKGGIQVYGKDGKYLRNVEGAPKTLHGFIINHEGGEDFIYASVLGQAKMVKMKLDGTVVLNIDGKATIPDKYKGGKDGKALKLTSVTVGPTGDIYIADGYGRDFIHRFDKSGKYLSSFGGREAPYHFKTAHKVFVDPRFEPNRLLVCDRANRRLVHLDLDGKFLGVIAEGIRLPCSADFHGDLVAVAELAGRAVVLDKEGKVVAELGKNETKGEISTNKVKPGNWKRGVCTAPHGLTFDADGNIIVTEWNVHGRVLRFDKK
ncbi:MAG: hypothetical protein L3J39_13235 [Verrucomicrobiales bacterium]|nr:hypothetical protein [Verrucomicrobiales bacterium]